jgi:endonuclease/exonuclease/phosphatase family metal-dependent hydrolase
VRVLTWNLLHGRAVPDRPRELLAEFAGLIGGWEWDVALLQEVPPWWGPPLGAATGAHARTALTSRNGLLPLRRWVAVRRPDLIKSNGGGANVVLVRGAAPAEHRRATLRLLPERRVVHGVRLGDAWVANLHAQGRGEHRAQADTQRAARIALGWCAGGPAVLGGDLNTPRPLAPGFAHMAGRGVDHVLARGYVREGRPEVPPRQGLSDHDPLLVRLRKETPR